MQRSWNLVPLLEQEGIALDIVEFTDYVGKSSLTGRRVGRQLFSNMCPIWNPLT